MSRNCRAVASFVFPFEADVARFHLQREDIPAWVVDDAFAGWFWNYSNAVGGVKVLVREEDVPRAREILDAARARSAGDSAAAPSPGGKWPCERCGARVPDDFEVCWSCGASAQGEPDPDFQRADAPIVEYEADALERPSLLLFAGLVCPPLLLYETAARNHPERPLRRAKQRNLFAPVDPVLLRACRASVVAIASPLFVYSLYLLCVVNWGKRLQLRRSRILGRTALAINVFVVVYYLAFLLTFFVWAAFQS